MSGNFPLLMISTITAKFEYYLASSFFIRILRKSNLIVSMSIAVSLLLSSSLAN
jgi:hypothetical protein